jgi:hypothetical protein
MTRIKVPVPAMFRCSITSWVPALGPTLMNETSTTVIARQKRKARLRAK